jgi:ribosomal protein S10
MVESFLKIQENKHRHFSLNLRGPQVLCNPYQRNTTKSIPHNNKKWEMSTFTMKERKPFFDENTNTKTMNRRVQVIVSRLRTGYTRATKLQL